MNEYGPIEAPSLRPDLEWMLQSQQVGDEALAVELMQNYYEAIKALVQDELLQEEPERITSGNNLPHRVRVGWFLGLSSRRYQGFRVSPDKIERMVERVLVRAVAQRFTYQSGEAVGEWLCSQVSAVIGTHHFRSLPEDGITMHSPEGRDWKNLAGQVVKEAKKLRRKAPGSKRAWEVASVVLVLLLASWVLWMGNKPAEKVASAPTASPTAEVNWTETDLPDASRILIPQRAQYETAWLDARVHFPEWQSMAPSWYRVQAWIGKEQLLAVGGPDGESPTEGILITDGIFYRTRNQDGVLYFERLSLLSPPPFQRFIFTTLDLLLNGDQGDDRFYLQGKYKLAGRQAWSLKVANSVTGRQAQLWLDEQTGFILRYHILGSSSYKESFGLPDEVRVDAAAFDVTFPEGLFDPGRTWKGNFVSDVEGN